VSLHYELYVSYMASLRNMVEVIFLYTAIGRYITVPYVTEILSVTDKQHL